jgi:ParB family transcriptional regulator, chromosome partitioning protein
MRKKGGLGRGLGSLIPQGTAAQEAEQPAPAAPTPTLAVSAAPVETAPAALATGALQVPIEAISPNPRQPRQGMEPQELDELAASIREHGILQPVVVTHAGEDERGVRYSLIAGERRWRAAMQAGLDTVPVTIKEASSREMLELALVENLQRADLNPLEEASAYKSLVEEFGLKHEEIASRVGKSRQAVANSLRLLRLPRPVQEALSLGLIDEGHARAILQVPTEHEQVRLMERAVADGLNVRQVEELARRLAERAAQPQQEEKPPQDDTLYSEVRELEGRFRSALGTKVQLSKSSRGGKLVIYFYSDEELDRIYSSIVGEEE